MEELTVINSNIQRKLTLAVRWAKYAATISFLNLGLGLFQMMIGVLKGSLNITGAFVLSLISTIITLILSINLLNFSKYANEGLLKNQSTSVYKGLYHLRAYFIVMGILFLIAIGLLVLFIVTGIISTLISITQH
jgi:hypothetical protein